MKSLYIILGIIALTAIGLFYFLNNDSTTSYTQDDTRKQSEVIALEDSNLPSTNSKPLWLTTELTDISTGKTFTLEQFNKPIIIESFAVWCPTCTSQQRQIKILHGEIGDDVISISLNTDPNEDANKVKQHIEKNGFDWYYAISPSKVTQSLIDDFGVGFVNAPSAPLVIIYPDKSTKKLRNGVKSADELKEELKL